MSSDQPVQFSFDTGAEHDAQVKLEPVRVRVLDRFGEPLANASCNVDTPILGTRTRTLDGKGWLDIKCPKGTAYVDLDLGPDAEDPERRVWLAPLDSDDAKETTRRLRNLGYGLDADNDEADDAGGGGDDADDAPVPDDAAHCFLDGQGVAPDDDLGQNLDRIENDLKTLDSPPAQDKNLLTDKAGDTSDLGERT
jgi:hypothetical protein